MISLCRLTVLIATVVTDGANNCRDLISCCFLTIYQFYFLFLYSFLFLLFVDCLETLSRTLRRSIVLLVLLALTDNGKLLNSSARAAITIRSCMAVFSLRTGHLDHNLTLVYRARCSLLSSRFTHVLGTSTRREIKDTVNEDDLHAQINDVVSRAADTAFLRGDSLFRIGVSGGSMVDVLATCLPKITTDWTKWRIFFCDERIVEPNDQQSNLALYKSNFIDKVPVTEEQFIQVDPKLSAEDAAMDYIKKISSFFPPDRFPRFDCLLLGVGPDGHTCSLFPNHTRALEEINMWVTWEVDSPKPPPCRISLTLPVINNARLCVFIATGSSKADIVKRILELKEDLPATRVQPTNGLLYWFLDKDASGLLNNTPQPETDSTTNSSST